MVSVNSLAYTNMGSEELKGKAIRAYTNMVTEKLEGTAIHAVTGLPLHLINIQLLSFLSHRREEP